MAFGKESRYRFSAPLLPDHPQNPSHTAMSPFENVNDVTII